MSLRSFLVGTFCALLSFSASAADYPAAVEGDWVAKDFKFHTGEVMPEMKIHYRTIGAPTGIPVLILHGTAGSGASLLTPAFAGELFGAGQPLDASRYYIILPDAIGTGKTTKPSDGLRAKFPEYNYDDMVRAQHMLVSEGLGIKRLRTIIGHSMGGMHAWMWGQKYPAFMDSIVPMASQPTEMSSRNWMMRRMIIDAVRNDPTWQNGNYTTQPQNFRLANVYFGIATNGGSLNFQKNAPTREKADALLEKMMANQSKMDANDFLYQWNSSRDYNAAPGLDKIEAAVLAINAADDERNPPETGLMDSEIKRLKNGQYYLIPASAETNGHNTTANARHWKLEFEKFMKALPVT